jgi:hypothetical protein
MTAVDTSPGRRRLFSGWRKRLTPDTTAGQPAAVTPSPCSPEEAPVGHIYLSDQPEPGQETTAIGRHHTAEHLIVTPREIPGDRTQVIRVPQRNELGQATDMPVEGGYDPPIFLRTLADVQGLRALPPAVCPACGLKRWDAESLQPGDEVCTCDDPFGDAEDCPGDAADQPAKEDEDR